MIDHLEKLHGEVYTQYLKDKAVENKEKAQKIKENRQLEEEVAHGKDELAELQGTSSQLRQRPVTTPITKFFSKGGPVKYKPDSDMQRRAEMDMAIYFVTGNLPFNHIESKAFRRFMKARDPKVTVKSRSSLVKTTIPLLERNLAEARTKLLDEHLEKIPGAAFTSDIWSSRGQNSYLSVTMHFIDNRWTLHNLVMGCRHLEQPSHTGDLIRQKVESVLEEIPVPVSANISFTTDGASSMVKAMKDSVVIQEHIVCVCHTISNSLQEAFSHPLIEPAVTMLKDLAGATHKSIKRITAIRRACAELKEEGKFL